MRTPSSTRVRWIGWTVLFGLALVGSILLYMALPWADPTLAWVLLAGLVALAFAIGVRLRTWWWVLGPVVAYNVPATIFMITVNVEDQARSNLEKGLGYAMIAVMLGAAMVVAPSTLAALAGTAWAAVSRSRAAGRRRDEFTKRWSGVRRFFTVEDATDQQGDVSPPA